MEDKFKPYLEDSVFKEVLDLVKQNSKGKIWLMGGFLYKNLASALYGGEIYNFDIDFVVEERNDTLKEATGWEIQTNSYGRENYVRIENKTAIIDLRKVIRYYGIVSCTIEKLIEETPFNIQSIAYDLEENKIIGEKGVEALKSKIVKINNKEQADFYAKRKGRDLKDIIIEKAKELGFDYALL